MAKEYTDQEVEQLVSDIRTAIQQEAEQLLIKSEGSKEDLEKDAADGNAPPPDEKPAEAPPAEAAGGDAPAEDAPADAPPEESSDSSSDSSSSDSSSDSSSSSSSDSSSSDSSDEKSEGALEDAYGQLSDEDLKAHYDAIKAVIMSRMGGDEGDSDAAAQENANAAPPTDAPENTMKSEKELNDKLSKTEETLAKAEAEIKETQAQLSKMVDLVEALLRKPQRKAVTSVAELEIVAKSEANAKPAYQSLSKNEITSRLSKKAATPDLSKSDRELINGYYLGSVNVKDIEHLLK